MAQDEGRDCQQEELKQTEWLVMIYLAGDNNLSANCLAILQELEAAFYSEDVRVLACFDSNTPRPRGARYFEINRRKRCPDPFMDWALHDDLIPFECIPGPPVKVTDFCKDLMPHAPKPEPPTGPVARVGLSRFLDFALSNYPARRRMLILYGHGSAVAGNTFLVDDNPPSFLRLKDFKEVLADHFGHEPSAGKPGEDFKTKPMLDILACDNCIMNGIESAFEIRRQVNYVIGSQGLALALGWPFRNILNTLVSCVNGYTNDIAKEILRVCARSVVDFALMDRSSEQSLCDLTTFSKGDNLVTAVKKLSKVLQDYLATDKECGHVKCPPVRDAVRLARLEAQSYWGETFVDLYDFCALLIERCNDVLCQAKKISVQLQRKHAAPSAKGAGPFQISFTELEFVKPFGDISDACWKVLKEIKAGQDEKKKLKTEETEFVISSYYVGPELQYSNGVSIYFPWTLPDEPIIFERVPGGGGGPYYISWAKFERVQELLRQQSLAKSKPKKSNGDEEPEDFKLVTAFDEYLDYEFADKDNGADWASFLEVFFRATLRDVRRFDVRYENVEEDKEREKVAAFFRVKSLREDTVVDPAAVNLQKSGSDVDSETGCTCPAIKNYPRRFYVSPRDCLRRCCHPHSDKGCHEKGGGDCYHRVDSKDEQDKKICVSYLGWNVRGIVAEVIKLQNPDLDPCEEAFDGSRVAKESKPKVSPRRKTKKP